MTTTILEVLGLALVVAGIYLVSLPAALVVAGLSLLWISRSVSLARGTETKR